MSGTVVRLVQRCPACEGRRYQHAHRQDCPLPVLGTCICRLPDDACRLRLGLGEVEPRHVTVWKWDMGSPTGGSP